MVLSKKSTNFIENLRLYLLTSGKKEKEVDELIEELTAHLIESEKQGKSIDQIIEGTPEEYMQSLKNEMDTDFTMLFKYIPIFIIGMLAYFFMGPAIRGDLEINLIQLICFPFVAVLAMILYVRFLQTSSKKQYSNKKLFIGGMFASMGVTLLFVILILGSHFIAEPIYTANDTVKWIVIAICTIIFVVLSIWTKTWITIVIPAILFIPDYLTRFAELSINEILIANVSTFILLFTVLILYVVIKEKMKKKNAANS
ncbi:HAAS domain-containing protein [Lederbergia graminis]|uniref:HAAS domain-containing protein n=1 Tax=Lederbergia graminis TaxID=735518 RepID=A0ABW0LL27_9BACI